MPIPLSAIAKHQADAMARLSALDEDISVGTAAPKASTGLAPISISGGISPRNLMALAIRF